MTTETFTFFWNNRSPLSNWYPSRFTVNNIEFKHRIEFTRGEQYMMYSKAIMFNDMDTAAKIMLTDDPAEQKRLGREVRGYDEDTWAANRVDVMVRGLYAKFTQNEKCRIALISTAGTTLVEASPYDRIWGIGLTASDPRAQQRSTWLGQNLLGRVLDHVRDQILSLH